MWRNYLKTSWRALLKNRTYSLVNIGGLALGLAVSTMILLYVLHEFSYDRFHEKTEQIHRLKGKYKFGDKSFQTLAMSAGFGPIVKENFPEIEETVRIRMETSATLKSDRDHIFQEDNFLLTDPTFFSVFSFPILEGNTDGLLEEPQTLVITPDAAKRYFGKENPIGKTLFYGGGLPFKIVGIVAPAPSNSTIQYDFVAALSSLTAIERYENPEIEDRHITLNNQDRLSLGSIATYLQLKPGTAPKDLEKKIFDLSIEGMEEVPPGLAEQYFVEPLKDLHLKSNTSSADTSNVSNIYLFLGIAFLILALALINYISLSTARLIQRAKEVGVRKVMGARKHNLVLQFFSESAMMTLTSFTLGIILLNIMQPYFYALLDLKIDATFFWNPYIIGTLVGLLAICTLISGIIPAYGFSSFSPVKVLKGSLSSGKQGNRLRQALIIFQFVATLALIIGTIVVSQQLKYLQRNTANLMDEPILVVPFNADIQNKYQAYRNTIKEETDVKTLAAANGKLFKAGLSIYFINSSITKKDVPLGFMTVDEQFFNMFNLDWEIEPVDYNRIGSPKTVILNEIAAAELGMIQDSSVNKTDLNGGELEVVGVLKDFHYQSLRSIINPLALFVQKEDKSDIAQRGGAFYLEFDKDVDLSQEIASLKKIHQTFDPENPFDYYFLDETLANFYLSERRLNVMLTNFTGLAIFISCLGLFGLITYSTERRTKEIGIRKVLGASVASIVNLLSKEFIFLVLIALMIAAPVAWYFMDQWLENFAYRIEIQWWIFVLAGLTAMALALFTISTQSVRAALANPVESLRNE